MSLQGAIEHSQAQLEIFEEGLVRSQYAELLGLLRELQERRSAPLYSPVKPEDIANGWYFVNGPDMKKQAVRVELPGHPDDDDSEWIWCVGKTFGTVKSLTGSWHTFYRIPDPDFVEVA